MQLGLLVLVRIACLGAGVAEPGLIARPLPGAGLAAFPSFASGKTKRRNGSILRWRMRTRSLVAAARECREDALEAQQDPKDARWR